MIKRAVENKLKKLSKQYPVVIITGPRQSGKTTGSTGSGVTKMAKIPEKAIKSYRAKLVI
jgi:predicted AAA+ superfamily ATPase